MGATGPIGRHLGGRPRLRCRALSTGKGSVGLTPYRVAHTELKPFGPVENGIQTLYGLDYRMAAWRGTEDKCPFHTEVGYSAVGRHRRSGHAVLPRIPRGSALIAGGPVAPLRCLDRQTWFGASWKSEIDGILSNLRSGCPSACTPSTTKRPSTSATKWCSATKRPSPTSDTASSASTPSHTDSNTLHKISDASVDLPGRVVHRPRGPRQKGGTACPEVGRTAAVPDAVRRFVEERSSRGVEARARRHPALRVIRKLYATLASTGLAATASSGLERKL